MIAFFTTDTRKWSRRIVALISALLVCAIVTPQRTAAEGSDSLTRRSPDEQVQFNAWLDGGRLHFSVDALGGQVVEPSPVSFSIDGVDLTGDVRLGEPEAYEIDERYPWRGNHSEAVNRCRGVKVPLEHVPTGSQTTLEVRVYDDGVAYRHLASGGESARIPDETTQVMVPTGSRVWFHNMRGHYEGVHQSRKIEEIAEGQWLAPPVTYQLPGAAGYVAITEAALFNYSGMALVANGKRGLEIGLGHKQPVSYPFQLRYEADIERLHEPAAIRGDIVTPWRVIKISPDLNGLINSDIVHNCSPPPDPELFPDGFATSWVRPGRAIWRYLDGGSNTMEEVKQFSDWAGELGFEYQVVEGFWRRWSDEQIIEVVEHSRERGVGLIFWEHSENLRTDEAQERFFQRLQRLGVAGAKIDFFDHEHRDVVDLYPELLEAAARHQILVNFHGSNKPTGDQRTWPNELIREGVRGAESRNPDERARHNTKLPFTRYLAGPADYTPVLFGDRRNDTSWAHQIATAVVFTHPLLTYAAHPQKLLENPAVDVIRTIPSVWDETIALPECEIGVLAAFARRHHDIWYLAVLDGGTAPRTLAIPLDFLDGTTYQATLVKDHLLESDAVEIEERLLAQGDALTIPMIAGGGFLVRFVPVELHEQQLGEISFNPESSKEPRSAR